MHHLIRIDLEAVAGVDSFTRTRAGDAIPSEKDAAMRRLAEEVNACIEGTRSVDPDGTISVRDQHGSGGTIAVRGDTLLDLHSDSGRL